MACVSRLFCCFPTRHRKIGPPSLQAPQSVSDGHPEAPAGYDNIYGVNGPQWSTSSLPRYTARPVSVYEKTIVHGRGPNPQEDIEGRDPRDEKRQQHYTNDNGGDALIIAQTEQDALPVQTTGNAGDQSSDTSSTFSIPSSYGNTSTATRTPPPPPYSATTSRCPSRRSRSVSLTGPEGDAARATALADVATPAAPELQQPQPVLRHHQHGDQWSALDAGEERRSWESRRSTPPLPPFYSRT